MSYAEDFGHDYYHLDKFGEIKVIENNFVIEKEYCLECGSLNIKTSKKGNKYCANLCWSRKTT